MYSANLFKKLFFAPAIAFFFPSRERPRLCRRVKSFGVMEYCEINDLVKLRADSIKHSNDFFSTSPVQKSYTDFSK